MAVVHYEFSLRPDSIIQAKNSWVGISGPNHDNNRPPHPQNDEYDDGSMPFYDNQQPPEDVEKEWDFVQQYMSLNEVLRKRIGHSFESFIQSCLFRGVDCHNETYVAHNYIKAFI